MKFGAYGLLLVKCNDITCHGCLDDVTPLTIINDSKILWECPELRACCNERWGVKPSEHQTPSDSMWESLADAEFNEPINFSFLFF